jgi:5-(carboxyamino)imidazole ribonucleotide synthase
MMIEAAIPLGIGVTLLAERPDDGAALVCPSVLPGRPDDREAMRRLADAVDVITFDHELVDVGILADLEQDGVLVRPGSSVMALVQDKLAQRQTLGDLGCPVPEWLAVGTADDIVSFGDRYGWPTIVKAVRGGYDGRGVWTVRDADSARQLVRELGPGAHLLVERRVNLVREVAVQVARRPGGETAVYPVIETVQVEGICRELRLPASISDAIAAEAESLAHRIATAIGLVGLLAVELFVERTADGTERLIVNELAARPHNSAHWTIEGSVTSQFAQHLRAVVDWPLGETTAVSPAVASVNVLGAADWSGDPVSRVPVAVEDGAVRVHLYGKTSRPGRKIGHVTLTGEDLTDLSDRAYRAAAILSGEGLGVSGD